MATKTARPEDQELNAYEIVDRGAEGTVQLQGRDPRKTFFMGVSIGNLDSSMDEFHGEGIEAICDTVEEAIEAAADVNYSYPTLEVWIFKCVPVAKVWRGKMRVTRFS